MSFDNDYPNRKDWRQPYRSGTGKSIDSTCRNHGGCPICEGNRQHKHARRAPHEDEWCEELDNADYPADLPLWDRYWDWDVEEWMMPD